MGMHVDRDDVVERKAPLSATATVRRCRRSLRSAANRSSAVGSSSESRLATTSTGSPRRMRLTGASSFLPVSVRGIAGTARIGSGTWRGESCDAQRSADAAAQVVVELDAVGEHDEEHELARAALVVLEVDDQAVGDLGQLLDDAVELAGAEPHAAAVERRVGAAGDDAAAALGER